MNSLLDTHILEPSRRDIINCRNLTIRPISSNEITKNYISWLNDSEINQFLEVRYQHSTLESVIKYINYTRSIPGCEFFAIFLNTSIHIGNINITSFNINNIGYTQYGMMIGDKNARDLGLGGLASLMIVEYLFSMPEIRKIECFPIAANEKSWKTTESLGFTREGILRDHDKLSNGSYTDTYVYGIFKKEWAQKRNQYLGLLKNISITHF
jgi:ribosomal-protein-alanine N-acetyltransferase